MADLEYFPFEENPNFEDDHLSILFIMPVVKRESPLADLIALAWQKAAEVEQLPFQTFSLEFYLSNEILKFLQTQAAYAYLDYVLNTAVQSPLLLNVKYFLVIEGFG